MCDANKYDESMDVVEKSAERSENLDKLLYIHTADLPRLSPGAAVVS
jgi:hypothetical protein